MFKILIIGIIIVLIILVLSVMTINKGYAYKHSVDKLDAEEWKQLQTIMKDAGELQKEVPHEALVNTKIAESVIKK